MTIQFKIDTVYTLGSLKLICTYLEDNTIWLKSTTPASHTFDSNGPYTTKEVILLYKLDRKSKKLYVFNTRVQAYDLVEGSLSEDGVVGRYRPEDVMVIYDYLE